jgi:hypothetical protein
MREFLYSEIANLHGFVNLPSNPDLAVHVEMRLCRQLLEPLQAAFGRISIRSGYRSPEVNEFGNKQNFSCARNSSNRAGHIWDEPNEEGHPGAMATIALVPGPISGGNSLRGYGVVDPRQFTVQQAAVLSEADRVQYQLA